MPKVLKIEESKIVTKNGLQVQRVIFSNDKIVYVKIDDGEVYPKDTPDRYVDLINTYNASHDNVDSTKPKTKPSEFWGSEVNYIKDGSSDRRNQIEKTKDKKRLSKDRDTQNAINRIRGFGITLRVCGVLQVVLAVLALVWFMLLPGGSGIAEVATPYIIVCTINAVLGIVYDALGQDISRLKSKPSTIRTVAIIMLVIAGIDLLSGWLGIMGLIVAIYAIIALVKVGRYEEWFYGEIE